ncbi:MAG: hypothetical protein WC321_03005 [Candidatus Omnitrophota bacterium]
METISPIRREFVASHLRSQLERLRRVVGNIEVEDARDRFYAKESLREIEANLRRIRKLNMNHYHH